MRGKFENYKICLNIWDEYQEQVGQDLLPDAICHYTETAVLDSILEHAVFWASNIKYMNDFSEYEWGAKHLLNNLNNPENGKNKVSYSDLDRFSKKLFSISFAGDMDSLHQWLTYAKESGVCIEFDKDLLYSEDLNKGIYYFGQEAENPVCKENNLITETPFLYQISKILRSVLYKEPNYKTGFDHELVYSIASAYTKNPAFKIENEYRSVFYAVYYEKPCKKNKGQTDSNIAYSRIRYCHRKNGVLRPYMKVAILKTKDKKSYEACLPIKSIIVGPSGIQQTIFDAIVHRCKYGVMKVNKYEKQDLCDRLIFYIDSAIDEWENTSRELDDEQKKKVVNKLLHSWYNEYYDQKNIYEFMDCVYWDQSRSKLIYNKEKTLSSHDRFLDLQENKSDSDELVNRAFKEISRDNFLTAEGIWIKKSKIPYLYS